MLHLRMSHASHELCTLTSGCVTSHISRRQGTQGHAHTQLDIKTGLAQEIMNWRATVFVQPLPPKIVKQTEQLLKRCSRDNVEDLATLTTSPQVLAAACVQVPRSPRVVFGSVVRGSFLTCLDS